MISFYQVVALQSKGFVRDLNKGGKIQIVAEEVAASRETVLLAFEAKNLDNKDTFSKSDPFLEISRANENGEFSLVHRTEVVDNDLSPSWRPFQKDVTSFCNGDYDRVLKIEVLDDEDGGNHKLIGTCQTDLKTLVKGPGSDNVYDLINEKKRQKKGSKYKNSGTLILKSIQVESNPTFLDYLNGGLQVNFTVAIDFTGSNGNPSDTDSLHYRDPNGRPNQYVTAIKAVGDIVQDYDSDKRFPSLGFGARIPPSLEASHEFFLTLDPNQPFCVEIDGVIAAYYNSLNTVELYGPTNFSPVINHVAAFASAYQSDASNYFVLLILTDGIITDFNETMEALIKASSLPMSVVIVGVGDEDFSEMDRLDGDRRGLSYKGAEAKRDIVQFVELSEFLKSNGGHCKESLARAVLAEVPGQVNHFLLWSKAAR